jgi:hypothetical protein
VKAIRRMMKIKDPNQLILTDLPFRVGDEIEVLILGKEKNEQDVKNLRSLFRETQSLPQMKSINESDITDETEAYRSGK